MKVSNQSIAPKQAGQIGKQTFSEIIAMPSYQTMLANAIQDPAKRQRFITTIISAVNTVPKLKECKPDTIITAALQMESLGLAYGLGDAYLIPYGDVAQFQMGARGYRTLAMRSGQYLDIDTIEVREGEYRGRSKQNGKPVFEFIEDDDLRETLPIVGYLAYFTLLNGFYAQEYFSHKKMLNWANLYSPSFRTEMYQKYINFQETGEGMTKEEIKKCSSPWFTSFESMASKTVIKQLLSKKGILSVELVEAFKNDRYDGTTDGMLEMNFVEKQTTEQDVVLEEKADAVDTNQQNVGSEKKNEVSATTRRGRPPKSVSEESTQRVAQEPFEFDGVFDV